ncbi:MAG: hypothetical protein A2X40_03040 [Elusimicrobia bacterium GWC2_65_9]|nr:MAG: hypothetical protein A2X40_03040 [Elusimicrobia bacterium GWC2_65_9]
MSDHRSRARAPIASARAGSSRSDFTAEARAAASPGGAKSPVTPSSTRSGRHPTRVATSGRPAAIHSSAARLTASEPVEAVTPMRQPKRNTHLSGTRPGRSTVASRPRGLSCQRSRSSRLPSPAQMTFK